MDEPKRWTMVNPLSGVTCKDGTVLRGGVVLYKDDDPAIVQALANNKALADAGLLDEDGNLRKIVGTPVLSADGCILLDGGTVWRSRYDTEDDEHYVQQFQTRIATNFYSWSIDSKRDFVDKSLAYAMRDTREAAERAAKERSDGQ